MATKMDPTLSGEVLPWVLEGSVVILDKRAFLAQIAACVSEKSAVVSMAR